MNSTKLKRIFAAALAAALIAVPASAFASHYRSVYSALTATGGNITWNLVNATQTGHGDSFSGTASIKSLTSSSDALNSGTDTGLSFTESNQTEDSSSGLYTSTTQVFGADVSTLADGTYESYQETCCRLDGVQNTTSEDSVSAWIRFTMSNGVPNLPPVFNHPSLYELITPNGTVNIDFRATDPERGAVTYTYLTDTAFPTYAGGPIPCSGFSGGILTISPTLCANGDVFSTIFDASNPSYVDGNGDPIVPSWTAKVEAKDAQGNSITSDVLFRLLTAPHPEIDDATPTGNGSDYSLDVVAPDTKADFFSVECVNNADADDVVTAQGANSPLTLRGLTVTATYTCTPYAENAAGHNTGDTYELGPVTGLMLNLELSVGSEFSGASSNIVGGGLKSSSPYTLTMHSNPIEIYAGVTDADGNFNEIITIPAEACIPGIHHLILTGVDPNDQPVSDDQWVEIGSGCKVLRFDDKKLKARLAETGFDATTGLIAASALGATGAFLTVARRRRQTRD